MMVVDAGIAVKWLLPEEGSEDACRLLGPSTVLLAPALIRVEVAAAVTRKLRMKELSESKTAEAYVAWRETLSQGTVKLIPDESILDEAVELARRIRHALQDCFYLALAVRHRIPLITTDRVLHNRGVTVHPDIQLLAGCQAN